MMKNKNSLILSLQEKINKKEFIVAAGVDSLPHVKSCQDAGCDLILLYPTSKNEKSENRFLAGYLAFGNTNELMLQTASEMMPIINSKNVLAGLNGSDPFKIDHILLKKIKQHNFAGIHNYPAMSLVDGTFGMNIDSLNLGIDKEMTLMKNAVKEDFFTCAMVQTPKQAHAMVKTGVDMIIFYLGLGEKDYSSPKRNISKSIRHLRELATGVRNINKFIPLLFYDERVRTIDEINIIAKEIPEINGYCLLPVTKSHMSARQLNLEIRQLKGLLE